MSGEKKRLEQDLLQRRASNIIMADPRFMRFQQRSNPIDRMRLLQSQQLAGQVPVSEALKKQQKKKKKKARKTKALRGDLSRNLTAQRRFTRGERREKDTEEPRIVGDPVPLPAGAAFDPAIERRKLDLEEAKEQQRQLERIADRRSEEQRQERELAVRRGELAAGRADRALIRAAIPAPAPPIVIPPAQVRVEAPQVRVEGAQVRVDPVINVPPPELPARADADPIPEIQRLGAQLRADTNAFGQEQEERNRDFFRQLREAQDLEGRQIRQSVDEVDARQQAQNENIRAAIARQDAINDEIQVRLGLGEVAMGQARDAVIQEFRDAEGRLRGAGRDLDRPIDFDDVILAGDLPARRQGTRAVEIEEVDSPTPEASPDTPLIIRAPTPQGVPTPQPQEPGGIGGEIAGGGVLNLPNVVVEQPGRIGPDQPLRLSPQDPRDRPGAVVEDIDPITGRPRIITRKPGTAGPTGRRVGGGGAIRAAEAEPESPLSATPPTTPRERELAEALESSGSSSESLQFQLDPLEPVNVQEALRLSRLAIEEAAPVLQEEEADEAEQQRLRLVDTQDFLAGFERPPSPQASAERASPRRAGGASPLVGGGTPAGRLEELLAQPSPVSAVPGRQARLSPTPTPRPEEETPEQALAIFQEAHGGGEEQEVGSAPRAGQVAQGISQFGGAGQPRSPAPDRVIEDAGIQPMPQERGLRPLDPDVLFEAVEEGEEVGQVQDQRPQNLRDSQSVFADSIPDLSSQVRPGPRGTRGQRGGTGYRVRNNTDRTLKKVEPGDVVNISGVEGGGGTYRLDTQTAAGTRVRLDQLQPLVDDGSFIFERGHRHELGGHFDEQPYGPPPAEEGPGLLQQGAEAAGGAVAGVVGGAARFAGGVAQGAAEGLVAQLPAAGDVGAALGRGAVAGVAGAGRLAAGAVGAALGGGEELEEEEEP